MPEPPRLILASNRAPNLELVKGTVLPHVRLIIYKYDTSTLDDILTQVQQELGRTKMDSIAILMHCSETEIFICFNGTKVLQSQSVKTDVSIRDFLRQLVSNTISPVAPGRRVDFLTVPIALQGEGNLLTRDIERLINMPVGMTKDLLGTDVQVMRSRQDPSRRLTVGELYFDVARLGEQLQAVAGGSDHRLDGYEKIRTVGKGAFGTAILYRKVNDDTMVVIKEVNMVDLNAGERQMALNEAQVLSRLDHPNIISYLGSFERDGVLMIEMEYADGGTLAQMLQQRANRLSEREILLLFRQIVAAIHYMHDHNILHRDLKTANVFLTKDGNIKVGDFGISKMMTTRGQANTVLGTPYYISPEMCEGKQYDQKSDIWALGCILYEMACLQKTFEGSNLPALVNKIMKGQFQPIPGGYSPGFRQLVHDLLQRDPMFRPTAAEILDSRLPKLMDSLVEEEGGEWFLEQDTIPNVHSGNGRSVLYDLKAFEYAVALTPLQLPPRSKIKEVAHSNTHVIVLTTELMVYTWGEGRKGQLGHGETEQWRQHPECVEVLKGKSINRIGAGDGYSVFVSDSGMLMTCGDGTFGCLGHGDWNNSVRPRLVEKLLSVDVAVVACGPHHVAVLSGDGDMYTWGRGDGGRLGLGNEEDCCIPMKVPLPSDCVFRTVRCGGDGTAVVTTEGAMLACGRNTYNKLGLGDRNLRLLSMSIKQGSDMDKAPILTRVKGIGAKVADVSLGMYHSAVLTESGHVITFGRNIEGQLGRGHARNTGNSPAMVKSMADKVATMVKCGPTYTVVGTIENAVYFWGTRYGGSLNGQDMMSSLMISHAETGTWSQSRSKAFDPALQASKTGSQYTNLLNASTIHTNHLTEVVVEPQEMLALYASPSQIAKGETVSLGGLFPLRYSVLILVETTVPLARLRPPGVTATDNSSDDESDDSSSSGEVPAKGPQQSSQDTEFDSIGPVPDWIREELAQSEAVWRNIDNSQSIHH